MIDFQRSITFNLLTTHMCNGEFILFNVYYWYFGEKFYHQQFSIHLIKSALYIRVYIYKFFTFTGAFEILCNIFGKLIKIITRFDFIITENFKISGKIVKTALVFYFRLI